MKRTYLISKQIEAESVAEALRLEKKAVVIGVVPASPHALEQLSAAIGTPITDYEAMEMGYKAKKKR